MYPLIFLVLEIKYVLAQAKDAEHTFYDHITIDTAGSEITSLVGSYAAFKINDGTNDEYFIAYVESSTKLSFNESIEAANFSCSLSTAAVLTLNHSLSVYTAVKLLVQLNIAAEK
mgnify:CR=1 FL=1